LRAATMTLTSGGAESSPLVPGTRDPVPG